MRERPTPQHQRVGEVDPDKPIEVTVYLRPSGSLDWVDQEAARPPAERRTMSREELASATGASDEDIAAVRSFAGDFGLEVTRVDQARRSDDAARHGRARSPRRSARRSCGCSSIRPAGHYRGRQRAADGSERARGRDHRRVRDRRAAAGAGRICGCRSAAAATSYTPPQVAAAYNFPTGVNGSRQTAAILELGGGFSQTDLDDLLQGPWR